MTIRITSHLLGGLAALTALCAIPAVAQDAQPLPQALTALSTANGFEVRGLDKVGDETVKTPKSGTPVQALRRILDGYAYTLELAPANAAGKDAGKLLRVSILGHAGDASAERAQASAPATTNATADNSGAETAPAADAPGVPAHPVTNMLRTIARSSMPLSVNSGVPMASGQTASVSSMSTGSASAPAPTATGNTAASQTDMAALTRTASANLSALVQSLKAACPAGGKC